MRRLVTIALVLGVIYVMTLASDDPVDLAIGTGLGTLLALALRRRLRTWPTGTEGSPLLRTLWFPVFAGAVIADIARGTWDVTLRVLHLRRLEQPGIVRVPIGERSDRGIAVSALSATLSPGSVLVEVDHEHGELLFHMIDASDPDGVRRHMQRFYERYQRRVFP